ncbi:cytochrome P450 11B1 [Crucibulum laeve]|uniref:Cytochrome P450 11B1 n=1 Tax=Crucibulum laeve TaxID=68775 RepID=A0A5C3LKW6_9AGAR|nr:cytochrome P450 11B1 [Crucibulum laeve]
MAFFHLPFSLLSCRTLLSIGVCITVLCFLANAIYRLFISPLSVIPGPWYASVSDFWLSTHVLRLRQCKKVQELFDVYGPVVRVGPNKVVFRDVSSMRNVYSVHKFDKSSYYKSVLTNDNDHAMTTLEHAEHAIRRKAYASHYTPSNVAKFQPEIHEVMAGLLDTLSKVAGTSALECLSLFRHLMVDLVVLSSYGYRLGAVSKWAMDVEDPLSTAISDFPKRGILRSIVPAWAWKIVCRIPNKRWRQLCDSDRIMAEFVGARVYEMRSEMNNGDLNIESDKMPMLQRLLQYQNPSNNRCMTDRDVISECMGHMIAASDTTSASLSYFFWELSRRPDIMQKLQAELDDAMPDAKTLPDIAELQSLPYLNAFIKEGLRLYGAAPSLLERVVPSSANAGVSEEFYDLMGFALPPGTIVSTQAWSMHRDTSIFTSPETFLPERWLESASTPRDQLVRMAQHMMPFGTGTRVCGGQYLAQVMLKIVVAAVARNFNVVAPSETNEKSMEVKDSFVIFPAAMECKLIFYPR